MDFLVHIVLVPVSLFGGKPVAVCLMLATLGIAVAGAVFMWWKREKPFLEPLRVLAAEVAKFKAAGPAKGEVAFSKLDPKFRASPLREAYEQFRQSLDFRNGVPHGSVRPEEVFVAHVLPGHDYPKWTSTWAGVFLTIGLLFTFLGLSAALLAATSDAQAGFDVEKMKEGVRGVLDVSAAKFLTSIAGLLAYVGWTVLARAQASRQERAIGGVVHGLSQIFVYRSPAAVLAEQLKTAGQMEAQLKDLGNIISVNLLEGIRGALDKHAESVANGTRQALDGSMSHVSESMDAVASKLSALASGVGESVTQGVGGAIEEGIGKTLSEFTDKLSKTVDVIAGFASNMEETQSRIADGGKDSSAAMSEAVASLSQIITDAKQGFGNAQDALKAQSDAASTGFAEFLRQAQEQGKADAQAMAESSKAAAVGIVEEMARRIASLAEAMERRESEASEKWNSGLAKHVESLATAGATATNQIGSVSSAMHEEFQSVLGALDESVQTFAGYSQAVRESTAEIRLASGAVERSVIGVGHASTQIASAASNVEAAGNMVSGVLAKSSSIAERIDSAADEMRKVQIAMTDMLKAADQISEDQIQKFEDLAGSVEKTIKALKDGVDQIASTSVDALTKFDGKVASSILGLASVFSELNEIIDDKVPSSKVAANGGSGHFPASIGP